MLVFSDPETNQCLSASFVISAFKMLLLGPLKCYCVGRGLFTNFTFRGEKSYIHGFIIYFLLTCELHRNLEHMHSLV